MSERTTETVAHVCVETRDGNGEWRQVFARTLDAALDAARAMPDVARVFEVSWIPGGVIT